jgi:hypothetical protein
MSEASSSAPPTGATPLSSPATTSLSSKMEKVDRDGNHMNSSSSSSMQSIPQSSIPPSNNTDKGDDADDESDKLPPGFNPAKIFRKKVKKDYVKIDLTNARDHKASQDMNNRKFEMHADNQRFNTSLLPKPISRSQILSNMFHHKKPSAPFGSLAHHAGVPNELVSTWRQPFRPPEGKCSTHPHFYNCTITIGPMATIALTAPSRPTFSIHNTHRPLSFVPHHHFITITIIVISRCYNRSR